MVDTDHFTQCNVRLEEVTETIYKIEQEQQQPSVLGCDSVEVTKTLKISNEHLKGDYKSLFDCNGRRENVKLYMFSNYILCWLMVQNVHVREFTNVFFRHVSGHMA